MMEFANNTEYELSEDERAALLMTMNECLANANDAQLEAIHNYALSVAPIPRAKNVDRARFDSLYNSVSDVLTGISDGKTPGTVAVSAYEALGISPNKILEARLGLTDYLNNCTATAFQTGDLSNLEHMAKVITTIHDLVGDYERADDYKAPISYDGLDDEEDDGSMDFLF